MPSIVGKYWDNADMRVYALATTAPMCDTSDGGLIGTLTAWLVSLMESIGGIGVMLAIALESIFPPIPSEIILPLAGFTASRGTMPLFAAIIWATIGSLLGALTLYGVSRLVGLHRIHRAADVIPGVNREDVNRASGWFERYGTWSVLIGRVIPVVRSLISIPAGFNRMNLVQFSGWTLTGSAVWNTILVTAGYVLGDNWCSILGVLNVFEDIVIGVVIAIILVCIVVRARKLVAGRRARRSGNESAIPEERREQ